MRVGAILALSVLFAGCEKHRPVDTEIDTEIASPELIESAMTEPSVPVMSDEEIPAVVRKRLSRVAGEEFHVAPPGSATHADRALIFAARSENYFTICYQVISRSMSDGSRVIIAATGPGENDGYGYLICVARCRVDCRNMSELHKAFTERKLYYYRPTFIDF